MYLLEFVGPDRLLTVLPVSDDRCFPDLDWLSIECDDGTWVLCSRADAVDLSEN